MTLHASLATLDLERRIDRLIEPWDRPGSPGVTVAIIRDGIFVARRHAGLASVELGHPIGDETCFRVASVTKQFTCLAILLLRAEGKLSLDDDIRTHLPELPDLGARITLDHLMRNTSGMRDMFELMRLGGLDLHQPCRFEDLYGAIRRQRGLNFAPGTRFLYGNSNFLLLGLVVEKLAATPLAAFFETRIFRPLGMSRTRLVGGTEEIVPGLATGYLARPAAPGGFVKAQHGYPLGGEGGLVSSVEDLALWDRNFAHARVGGRAVVAALEAQAPFANGTMNAYARGLEIHHWRGLRTVGHGGLWPGFKTLFMRIPEPRLTIICIANVDAADVHALGHAILDEALVDDCAVEKAPSPPPRATLEPVIGRYLDRDSAATIELAVTEDGRPTATMNGATFALVPRKDGRLVAHRGAFPLALAPMRDGSAIAAELDAGVTATFHRVRQEASLPGDIAGSYANDETEARWTALASGALTVDGPVAKASAWTIEPIEGDFVRIAANATWLRAAFDGRILRDAAGKVTGLMVSGGRVKNMLMRRVAQ